MSILSWFGCVCIFPFVIAFVHDRIVDFMHSRIHSPYIAPIERKYVDHIAGWPSEFSRGSFSGPQVMLGGKPFYTNIYMDPHIFYQDGKYASWDFHEWKVPLCLLTYSPAK